MVTEEALVEALGSVIDELKEIRRTNALIYASGEHNSKGINKLLEEHETRISALEMKNGGPITAPQSPQALGYPRIPTELSESIRVSAVAQEKTAAAIGESIQVAAMAQASTAQAMNIIAKKTGLGITAQIIGGVVYGILLAIATVHFLFGH